MYVLGCWCIQFPGDRATAFCGLNGRGPAVSRLGSASDVIWFKVFLLLLSSARVQGWLKSRTRVFYRTHWSVARGGDESEVCVCQTKRNRRRGVFNENESCLFFVGFHVVERTLLNYPHDEFDGAVFLLQSSGIYGFYIGFYDSFKYNNDSLKFKFNYY